MLKRRVSRIVLIRGALALAVCTASAGCSRRDVSVAAAAPTDHGLTEGTIVFDGNSLLGSREGQESVSDALKKIVRPGPAVVWANVAGDGSATEELTAHAPDVVDPFSYPGGGANVCVIWEGSNDLYKGAGVEGSLLHLRNYVRARKAAGWTVVVLTLIPRGWPTLPQGWETERTALNAALRSTPIGYDRLVDAGADSQIGPADAWKNLRFFLPDGVHLTSAGGRHIAELMAPTVRDLFGATPGRRISESQASVTCGNQREIDANVVMACAVRSPGTPVQFAWSFSDGAAGVTTMPVIHHNFARGHETSVQVTMTMSGGERFRAFTKVALGK